jgi:DNA-binding winged helix-turn-helix (wHTH) protein/Tol biopolymer transport system component
MSKLAQSVATEFKGMNGGMETSYDFGPFRLEPATRRLLRDGEPLPLTPKAFDTLVLLVQNRERVVEKEEVLRRIWPDTAVEESNLTQNVFTLRKALGDTPEGARFIATVPRRGYRFVAPVEGPELAAAPGEPEPPVVHFPARAIRVGAAAVVLVLLPLAGYVAGRRAALGADHPQAATVLPKLSRLTFRRGIVTTARFAPDGRTVVYSASWDGKPAQVFLNRPDSPESMALDAPSADLLAVSRTGELALGLRPSLLFHQMGEFRTLARTAMAGGVPREVLRDVEAADWSADGQGLAVVRRIENRIKRLEYPIGNVLVEGTAEHALYRPRVSPDGALVAYVGGTKPHLSLSVVDAKGHRRALWSGPDWVSGLAWSPKGDEVWFSTEGRFRLPLARAVDLSGHERLLAPIPGAISDVSRDGGVLVISGTRRSGISGVAPGEREERDLSWLEGSAVTDLSADGRRVLFGERMEGGGVSGRIYLRGTDGSPAVHLGDGYPLGLSPDGTRAAVNLYGKPGLTLLPTGPGEARTFDPGEAGNVYLVRWFPDGRRLLVGAIVPGHEGRLYVMDVDSGRMRAITAEQTGVGVVSPDGKWVATIGHDGHFLYPVDGGERRPFPGAEADDWPIQWSADGRSVYVRREGELPLPILRIDVSTGRIERWKDLLPADRSGIVYVDPMVTADGSAYVYTYHRLLTELYLVEGLK